MQRAIAEAWRIFRFGLVGGAATVVHLVTAEIMAWLGVIPSLAFVCGFALAFAISYLGHRHFTFGYGSKDSFWRFSIIALVGLAVGEAVLNGLAHFSLLSGPLRILIGSLLVPVATYVAARLWAFRVEA